MSSADKITKFHQFHRGAGNSRRGVIAAEYNHTTRKFKIAHSLCNLQDNLDPMVGVLLAKGRLHDMEWQPIARLWDDNTLPLKPGSRFPETMRDTLNRVRSRVASIHDNIANESTDIGLREDDPTEAQIDQIIQQGVADARKAIAAGVCRGQCGCCG